jgi:hypothetical protein
MFTKEKKEESKAKSGKPRNRLLRLFRSNDTFLSSPVTLESADQEDAYEVNPKTIEGAMLDAEYQKARAVLEFQRNERFH